MPDRCPHVSRWSSRTECKRCREQREARERREHVTAAEAWMRRTGHCHDCGQPANYCQCTQPCGCARLHLVGSGIGVNPADVFAETPVSDDQTELFDLPETGE